MSSAPGVSKKKSSVAQALMKWAKRAGWPGPAVYDLFFNFFLFQLMLLFYFLKKLIIFILIHLSLLFCLESLF